MDEELKAEAAKQLLGNPTFDMALEAMKNEVISQWSRVPARDTEAREWLWMFYQNTIKFEEVLRGFLATGKIATFNREQETIAQKAGKAFSRLARFNS